MGSELSRVCDFCGKEYKSRTETEHTPSLCSLKCSEEAWRNHMEDQGACESEY